MFIIADIPPVSYVQEVTHAKFEQAVINNRAFLLGKDREIHSLVFLIQASRFVELSKNTEFEKAELNYERMALLNFQAYLQRIGG